MTAALRRAWPWLRQALPWALALAVLALVVRHARHVDWPGVAAALAAQTPAALAGAALLALASHALFASFDLVGRHETRHTLPLPRTLGIAAICYAFTLNFGSLVGSLAMKLRLYGRAGLQAATVARVIVLSMATNWLGYAAVAGAVLLLAPPPLPAAWPVPGAALQAAGAALLALSWAYLALALRRRRPVLAWRGQRWRWPARGTALLQLALAGANWMLMAGIVWLLLERAVDYPTVLAVLLLAAVAGVVTHVPGGLGVIEAVFVACLGGQVPQASLLAALLAYRAAYYGVPLLLALGAYAASEWRPAGQPCVPKNAGSQ